MIPSTISADEVTNYVSHYGLQLMNNRANLLFKKVIARPNSVDFSNLTAVRRLFAINSIQIVSPNVLIINVDESAITRNLKSNYSWTLNRNLDECKNSPLSGSVNVVAAITSAGDWFCMLTHSTINLSSLSCFWKPSHNWVA